MSRCRASCIGRRVMADRITYVGLDVHKESIVVAVASGGLRGEVREYGRIANTPPALDRLLRKRRLLLERPASPPARARENSMRRTGSGIGLCSEIGHVSEPPAAPTFTFCQPDLKVLAEQRLREHLYPVEGAGAGLCVGDREAGSDRQRGELVGRIAAGAPVRELLGVEALEHARMPFAGYRPDDRAGSSWPQSTRIVQRKRRRPQRSTR